MNLYFSCGFLTDEACDWTSIEGLVKFMNEKWNILSVTDMVYNHTANDSAWLLDHPESAYNLNNSPHLKPAYLLDRLVFHTSRKIASSLLDQSSGIPAALSTESHIEVKRLFLV